MGLRLILPFLIDLPINMDPSRQEMNPYQYGGANPIMYTDPSGQCFWDLCIIEISTVVIVAIVVVAIVVVAAVVAIIAPDVTPTITAPTPEIDLREITDPIVEDYESLTDALVFGTAIITAPGPGQDPENGIPFGQKLLLACTAVGVSILITPEHNPDRTQPDDDDDILYHYTYEASYNAIFSGGTYGGLTPATHQHEVFLTNVSPYDAEDFGGRTPAEELAKFLFANPDLVDRVEYYVAVRVEDKELLDPHVPDAVRSRFPENRFFQEGFKHYTIGAGVIPFTGGETGLR